MLELQVKQQVGLLNWNFEELNSQLDIELKRFEGVTITSDQVQEAKKVRANLNGLAKAINDRKIQVKKEFCAPYDEFESQVKVLTGKIKKVSAGIDDQVKNFEEMEKQNKIQQIQDFFELTGFRLVTLNQIFDEKWLNKSCSEKQWQEQLSSKIEAIKVDLAILDQMEVSDKKELKSIYLQCLDIARAKKEYDFREEKRAQIRASEEFSKQNEQTLKQAEETAQPEEQPAKPEQEALYTRSFRVISCTRQQIIDLGDYMSEHGIRFEKI